jgi:hypothetical protein
VNRKAQQAKAAAEAVAQEVARVADKHVLKAVRVVHAMAHLLHVAEVLHQAHGVIVKIVPKEVLTVRHPIDSTIAMIATTTDATTAAHGVTSCHVTLIHS